eukprot:TRINITY_DN32_c0_g1_i3.p1 TRINITY_DN32_c0_g1~~TRINITY_DN32_c0_g1_i3.p1  ORF type:complete len:322 (-),score=49.51 TRINITY_DN32_c0_g1_i3:94-1059(-)
MSGRVGVLLVGFGLAGQSFHFPLILCCEGLELVAIVSSKTREALSLANLPNDVKILSNLEEGLELENVQLVVLATPNVLHFQQAKICLLAGKNVVVDKPFTVTTAEADELIALAKEKNLLISCYQNRRFDADFLTVEKIVKSGELGEIVDFRSYYERFRPVVASRWREDVATPGSGLLYDLAPHLIHQVLTLFGNPTKVNATLLTQRDGAKVDDFFHVNLYFSPSPLHVTLQAGCLVATEERSIKIYGKKAAFEKYGLDVQETALRSGKLPKILSTWGEEPSQQYGTLKLGGSSEVRVVVSERGNYLEFYEGIRRALVCGR